MSNQIFFHFFYIIISFTVSYQSAIYSCYHDTLLINPPTKLYFHDATYIKENPYCSFSDLANQWQKKLTNTWNHLVKKLEQSGLHYSALDVLMHNPSISDAYFQSNTHQPYSDYIDENHIDSDVLHFIKSNLSVYTQKTNITIRLSYEMPLITSSHGTDLETHYIYFNANIYTSENIKKFRKGNLIAGDSFHVEKHSTSSAIRFIDIPQMLLIGIMEAASHINHQSNFFLFSLHCTNYFSNLNIPKDIIVSCWKYVQMRATVELILQANNPLCSTYFIAYEKIEDLNSQIYTTQNLLNGIKSSDDKKSIEEESNKLKKLLKEKNGWITIIQEVANCYSYKSLRKFNDIQNSIYSYFF